MAVSFKVPKSPSKSILTIDNFEGADFTNSSASSELQRSPNTQNMIRDIPGKVRKCMGYRTIKTFKDGSGNRLKINGYYSKRGHSFGIIHAGTNIYYVEPKEPTTSDPSELTSTLLYSNANNIRSLGWQFDDKIYIVDGKKLLVYSETKSGSTTTRTIRPVEEIAKIPLLTISKNPSGGGTPYEDLNLLSDGFIEQFLGDESSVDYSMSFTGLDSNHPVKVEVMNSNGDFITKTIGTDYSVDYDKGIIHFKTAPGKSPVTGEDNIRITAYRVVQGYKDRINKCKIGTLFGVNGVLDRLFLSGNPDYINYDWYSEQNDPTYFADTSYSVLGSSASAIVGYSIISNRLATHKDSYEKDQNIIIRSGDMIDSKPSFRIVNTLQGAGAISSYSFGYFQTEPLFLTKQGVFAVTSQDITGEKYAQNRSFYIDGKLLAEPNMEEAYAIIYKDMYWCCLNNVAYIIDGLQPLTTDKNRPYSTRQYVCYYRTNLPAHIMWEKDDTLYFGTKDGRVCVFYKDKHSPRSYNDDGMPIDAIWETPYIDGSLFYKNKTLRFIALRLESAVTTSVEMWIMNRGLWELLKKDDTSGRYLSFANLVFSKFSFSGDKTQHTFSSKARIKKVDKFSLRLRNNALNEPFGIYNIAFEYVENGNYKG